MRVQGSLQYEKIFTGVWDMIRKYTEEYEIDLDTPFYNNAHQVFSRLTLDSDNNIPSFGQYEPGNKKVTINRQQILNNYGNLNDTLIHEFLHAITDYGREKGISRRGLTIQDGDFYYGYGLDEFVTQFVSYHVCGSNRFNYYNAFDYNIINELIEIVDITVLVEHYLLADLNGLIEELEKVVSSDLVRKLVFTLDNYYNFMWYRRDKKSEELDYNERIYQGIIISTLREMKIHKNFTDSFMNRI